MDDEQDDVAEPQPLPASEVASVLIGFAVLVGFIGFLCWRIWPYIEHAGMR